MFRLATFLAVVTAILIVVVGQILQSRKTAHVTGTDVGRFPWFDRLAAGMCGVMFVGLTLTGFYDILILERAMTSWVLLIHVGLGGAFAVALAAFTFLRAEGNAPGASAPNSPLRKACFWIFSASGLALILTAALAMLPWLGTHGQHNIIAMHRWFALASLIGGIGYVGLGWKRRVEERKEVAREEASAAVSVGSGNE